MGSARRGCAVVECRGSVGGYPSTCLPFLLVLTCYACRPITEFLDKPITRTSTSAMTAGVPLTCRASGHWLRSAARTGRSGTVWHRQASRGLSSSARRGLSSSARLQTDGVFRALTDNRVQTPWIEALRKKQREEHDGPRPSGKPKTPSDHERDLTPRPMADSYHSVVRPWPCSRALTNAVRLTDADVDTPLGPGPMAA